MVSRGGDDQRATDHVHAAFPGQTQLRPAHYTFSAPWPERRGGRESASTQTLEPDTVLPLSSR